MILELCDFRFSPNSQRHSSDKSKGRKKHFSDFFLESSFHPWFRIDHVEFTLTLQSYTELYFQWTSATFLDAYKLNYHDRLRYIFKQ